ncbi:MAG: hypothetical protein AAF926_04560 [Pseudomonadota bacterium]
MRAGGRAATAYRVLAIQYNSLMRLIQAHNAGAAQAAADGSATEPIPD